MGDQTSKTVKNSVFSKLLFKKNHEADFFSKIFFGENVAQEPAQLLAETWCPYLLWGLRNLPHKFEKLAHVTKSAKKKRHHMGNLAPLVPQKQSRDTQISILQRNLRLLMQFYDGLRKLGLEKHA